MFLIGKKEPGQGLLLFFCGLIENNRYFMYTVHVNDDVVRSGLIAKGGSDE